MNWKRDERLYILPRCHSYLFHYESAWSSNAVRLTKPLDCCNGQTRRSLRSQLWRSGGFSKGRFIKCACRASTAPDSLCCSKMITFLIIEPNIVLTAIITDCPGRCNVWLSELSHAATATPYPVSGRRGQRKTCESALPCLWLPSTAACIAEGDRAERALLVPLAPG